jgi:hypothetical protein
VKRRSSASRLSSGNIVKVLPHWNLQFSPDLQDAEFRFHAAEGPVCESANPKIGVRFTSYQRKRLFNISPNLHSPDS